MEDCSKNVKITAEITRVVNFALQQNLLPVIRSISISNESEISWEDVILSITCEPEFAEPFEKVVCLPAGESVTLREFRLILKAEFLAQLTERIEGTLRIALRSEDKLLAEETAEITVLAYDEWHGTLFYPELLTAFVTPNHPQVSAVNLRAAQLLEKWTGNPSLDTYQSKNPNRVLKQAAAVYGALQEQNIVYCVPPASFEATGQRVRLCDTVMGQHLGTCLDLSLFYTACLEAMGLHPLLILKKGHIFAGLWLEELSFPEAVQDDPSLITKRLADGIGEIAVVECTTLTAGQAVDFEEARKSAQAEFENNEIELILDVYRARISGIRPLPQRIRTESGFQIEYEKREEKDLTDAPAEMAEAVLVTEGEAPPAAKKMLWERKLLDLGLRNTLINMRLTRGVIPILSSSLEELEDALSSGEEFGVMARPSEWEQRGETEYDFETVNSLGSYTKLIRAEFQNKRLRSVLPEGELARAIVNLYRSSRVALEENGANTLYLALGLLRWYESAASEKARYAPIILLPVEIIRKSANRGYVIRLRDEEAQMNITLLEMLNQDFGITITGLDPLPADEHGIDLRGVFSVLRRAVMAQPRWDVKESAFLGIFSFSQFVMWNDLRNRSEELKKNKVVRSLMDGILSWQAEDMRMEEAVPEDDVLLPLPADASQLFAIRAAARGKSFVLHGPPGTGKSQTITAMIANALAQGKTVLFVAEKMAALSVVERRLDRLGIGDFCLELHSNKSRKRDVLDQLRAATEITVAISPTEFERKADQAAALREELNAYAYAIRDVRSCGMSLFELIGRYEDHRSAKDVITFTPEYIAQITADEIQNQQTLMGRLIAAARAVGHPYQHPLSAVGRFRYSQEIKNMLPTRNGAYRLALEHWQNAGESLAQKIGWNVPNSLDEWNRFGKIAKELARWKEIPRTWAEKENLPLLLESIRSLAAHAKQARVDREKLLANWNPEFLEQDGIALEGEWRVASAKWFLPKLLGKNKLVKQLAVYSKNPDIKNELPSAFILLASYCREKKEENRLLSDLTTVLGELYCGDATDWDEIASLCTVAEESADALDREAGGRELRLRFAGLQDLIPYIEQAAAAYDECQKTGQELYSLLEIAAVDPKASDWLLEQQKLCRALSEHADSLKEWMVWKEICREAFETGMKPVVAAYEAGTAHDEIEACWKKALYRALIEEIIEHEPLLNSFSGVVFNEKIEQFRKVDHELSELAKQEIFYRLASRVPDFSREAAQSSELGILQRAIRSGGRGISIRRLFEQIPNLLPRLCPCMLMSPISAAQYLDPRHTPFDLVVFDEASQLPTCKAVGALARGREAIVVGDPNQMPPTSFFGTNVVEEDSLDTEDLESILDDCLALGMPQSHLLWHYRSRHESLIAFCNHEFYENRLFTFPSVNDRISKVSFVSVDGCFDRGKTRQNRAEAEAVVKELIHRYQDPVKKDSSVGVVTFNINQQNLIDDLFTEACKADPGLEAWAYESEEPLFIKNLENVQGDERDVILFSVGYGPDKDGKVFMNFGPLNREGGWRRLNVAVSRSRCEMMVFSALDPEQIDLDRTSAKGVSALRAFLEYAKKGMLATSDTVSSERRKQFGGVADGICQALAEAGYQTQRDVGHSQYRIDIGVADPNHKDAYLLGILLDGTSYQNAKTTRDREIAQISVLTGLGWKLHRIWTVDWWDNSRKEINRLLQLLEQLQTQGENRKQKETEDTLTPNSVLKTEEEKSLLAGKSEKYMKGELDSPVKSYSITTLEFHQMTADEFVLPKNSALIRKKIEAILNVEAPVSESVLAKRLLASCSIARAGGRIQAYLSQMYERMKLPYTESDGQRYFWKSGQEPSQYSYIRIGGEREAKDIPFEETANAILLVLKEQIGLPADDLLREAARKFGFARFGPQISAAMHGGMDLAEKTGRIRMSESGAVTLANE